MPLVTTKLLPPVFRKPHRWRPPVISSFGIPPTAPETGYGYIRQGVPLGEYGFAVDRFVEKPGIEAAKAMLNEGGVYWNGGLFFMRADVYLKELQQFVPEIALAAKKAWENRRVEQKVVFPGTEDFLGCPV